MKPEDTFSSHLDIHYPKIPICGSAVDCDQASGTSLLPLLSRVSSPLPLPYFMLNTDIAPSLRVNAILPLLSPVNNSETCLVGKKMSAFFSSPFDRDAPLLLTSIKHSTSTLNTYPPSPSLSSTYPIIPEPEHPQSTNSTLFFVKGSRTLTPVRVSQKKLLIYHQLIISKLGFKCSCSSCTNISIYLYNRVHKVQQLIGR